MCIKYFGNAADKSAEAFIRKINRQRTARAYVGTFGCQQNEADSEKIRGILTSLGFLIIDTYKDADLVIFNTCAIRAHAEDKLFSTLGLLKAQKANNPELIIGICGCMAAEQNAVEKLKTKFQYVSFTLEPNRPELLPGLIFEAMANGNRNFALGGDDCGITEDVPVLRASRFKAWVSVMYGCNNFCSYCIVPYVRGRERSRRSEDVLSECRELIASGVKEITLLGQNVNSYKSSISFPALLGKIAELDGNFTIRFMTSHPKDVSDELISVMAEHREKIAPYFHLPLQSGSNKILKAMNRTYDRDKFMSIVNKLREHIPDITLSTDVIVGFPGETEQDFLDTLDILERAEFDAVYGFMYSERAGTKAVLLDGKVEQSVKSDRLARLFAKQDPISLSKNSGLVGSVMSVMVNSLGGDDVVSAVSHSGKLVRFKSAEVSPGDILDVRIIRANPYELTAEMMK